jgi:hypothetical protein
MTMWDFSWLERRWPGAGYEDWDLVLDELLERGYDSVRIDAYPHLSAVDPEGRWELLPAWDQHDWGAPGLITLQVEPALHEFIARCAAREIDVALSSWFREDRDNVRMRLSTPEAFAGAWIGVLDRLQDAGLLDTICFVDLCNEFPDLIWAPWFYDSPDDPRAPRTSPHVTDWMTQTIQIVRDRHPGLAYTYSASADLLTGNQQDVDAFDLLEPHVWMSSDEISDFYARIGYVEELGAFDQSQFPRLLKHAQPLFESDPNRWRSLLADAIDRLAEWSRASRKPLATTEAWAVINYKDWPGADWGWIKDLCAFGVERAVGTGRWAYVCSNNFCGPQFPGMWRDVSWHRKITDVIRSGQLEQQDMHHRLARSASGGLPEAGGGS